MPLMRSKQPHRFGVTMKRPGDEFQATEREASLLMALQWADPVPSSDSDADKPLTRDTPSQRYNRRDMRARG